MTEQELYALISNHEADRVAQAALEKNDSPPAEFHFDAGYVLATIRMRL